MANVIGAIDKDLELQFFAAARERGRRAKEIGGEVLEKFQEDKAIFDSVCCFPNDTRYRRTTYTTLPYLIRFSQLPLSKAFAQLGIIIEWPNAEAERLYTHLANMDIVHQQKLFICMEELIHPFWREMTLDEVGIQMNPTQRLLYFYSRKYDATNDARLLLAKTLGPEFYKAYSDRKRTTTISTKGLVETARKLEISLHWLFGSDKSYSILADTALQEQIITVYLFSHETERRIVREYIKLARGVDEF